MFGFTSEKIYADWGAVQTGSVRDQIQPTKDYDSKYRKVLFATVICSTLNGDVCDQNS